MCLIALSVRCVDCTNANCANYRPTNKENIRNCLEETKTSSINSSDAISDNHLTNLVVAEEKRAIASTFKRYMPYLIVPGLLMSGLLPWIMPAVKMMVMTVSMVNQMAFTSALMAIVRSYIFDTAKEEHVVYVNQGYKKQHY